MALFPGSPVARKAIVAMRNASTLLNAIADREQRVAKEQGFPHDPYTVARFTLLRTDARALDAYAQETCHHPDETYNPPDADEGVRASCELCGRVWADGNDRDSERADG